MKNAHWTWMVAAALLAACSGAPAAPAEDAAAIEVARPAGPARCRSDGDCTLNPVDCSECGRCPGDTPTALMRAEVDSVSAECERHPPVRLNPRAAEIGLQRPACSPCPMGLGEPMPLFRAVCRDGGCAVEQAGMAPPVDGDLTGP
jgi:hypothetical protein